MIAARIPTKNPSKTGRRKENDTPDYGKSV
jgi:hypothetical protein